MQTSKQGAYSHHIGVVYGNEESNLVHSVHALKVRESREVGLLQSVELLIPLPLYLVNLSVRAFSQHLVDLREESRVACESCQDFSPLQSEQELMQIYAP